VPLTLALPRWWYRLHRWEVTDAAVHTRSGYFWQEWRVAPMSRIQTVDTQRGPRPRGGRRRCARPRRVEGHEERLRAS
jgi:membrane protein YdbS with pleckstrin-like domain